MEQEKEIELKRLLGKEAMYKLNDFWQDDEWTLDKLYGILAMYSPDPKSVNAIVDWILEQLDRGVELNNMAFRDAFKRQVMPLVNETFAKMDALSRMAAMTASTSTYPDGLDFDDYSPKFYVGLLEKPGTFGYISSIRGKPLGYGKTDVACKMIEFLLDKGLKVQTNILIHDKPEGLVEVRSLKQMVGGMVQNFRDGFGTVNFLDEFSQYVEKERATSGGFVNLKKAMYLFRKMGGSLIVINQRDAEVPNAIIEMSSWHIQKLSKPTMWIRRGREEIIVSNVERTSLPFETYDQSGFRLDDLDMVDMHNYVIEHEGENQLDAILEYLDQNHTQLTRRELMNCAKVMKVNGNFTQREIGEICGVSNPTIGAWLREMGIIS